jgi:hypothetical protein
MSRGVPAGAPASQDSHATLLPGIEPTPFIWAPKGHLVIMMTAVEEAGGDPDAVTAWVEANGGELTRTLPVVATRRGVTAIPKPLGKKYWTVPESALAG